MKTIQQSCTPFFVVLFVKKNLFESLENTTVNAAIVCPAVCISYVVSKADN